MLTTRPRLRKLALTTHIVTSVGWLGAVAAFLALAVAGQTSADAELARAACLAMEQTARSVLVPLSLLSLLTGAALSLGTKWGLLRHYWVLAKLLMNVVAIPMLMLYAQTLSALTDSGRRAAPGGALERASPLLHASAALLVLLAAVALSVYKPRGMTRRGRRTHDERRSPSGGRRATD